MGWTGLLESTPVSVPPQCRQKGIPMYINNPYHVEIFAYWLALMDTDYIDDVKIANFRTDLLIHSWVRVSTLKSSCLLVAVRCDLRPTFAIGGLLDVPHAWRGASICSSCLFGIELHACGVAATRTEPCFTGGVCVDIPDIPFERESGPISSIVDPLGAL